MEQRQDRHVLVNFHASFKVLKRALKEHDSVEQVVCKDSDAVISKRSSNRAVANHVLVMQVNTNLIHSDVAFINSPVILDYNANEHY